MNQFFRLAFRNVFRNRRRTLMTLAVAAGGVAALMVAGGFFASMFRGLRETTIRNGLGHLQVYDSRAFTHDEKQVLDNGLDRAEELVRALEGVPHVRGVAPRIEFYGMVSNGKKSSTFMATAVDPLAEERMGFTLRVTAGRRLATGETGEAEALIGAGLAKSLNVKPGDGLTLLAVTSDGALNGLDVQIAGVAETGVREMDERLLRITLKAAQRLLQSERVTKLVVGLDRTEDTDATARSIARQFAGLRPVAIRKWHELATFYNQVRLLFSGMFVFLGVIVFFMVVMSSANTLMMAMFERTREIGAMLAMGTPRSWVMGLFVAEGLITGVAGAALGIVCGNLVAVALNYADLNMPPPPGNTTGFAFEVLQEPGLMVASALLVIVTLAVASLIPAWRASRLNPIESLASV